MARTKATARINRQRDIALRGIWPKDYNSFLSSISLNTKFLKYLPTRRPIHSSIIDDSLIIPYRFRKYIHKTRIRSLMLSHLPCQPSSLHNRSLRVLKLNPPTSYKNREHRPLCARKLVLMSRGLTSLSLSGRTISLPTVRKHLPYLKKLASLHLFIHGFT